MNLFSGFSRAILKPWYRDLLMIFGPVWMISSRLLVATNPDLCKYLLSLSDRKTDLHSLDSPLRYMTHHGVQTEHFLFAKWGWSTKNNHVWWHMMRCCWPCWLEQVSFFGSPKTIQTDANLSTKLDFLKLPPKFSESCFLILFTKRFKGV